MTDDDVSGCMAFFVCQRHPTAKSKPLVALQYRRGDVEPSSAASDPSRVSFCFPVATEMYETRRVAAPEEYSYTMTGDRGDRCHGFCRKIYWSPSYKTPKFPVVLCTLSNELWPIFHFKVLEVMQELLMQERLMAVEPKGEMPKDCAAALFLDSVNRRLTAASAPGSIITIHYPDVPDYIRIEAPQKINALNAQTEPLKSSGECIEMQVPPLTGRSPAMSGVSLARLLWRIPVKCLMTLIASLILERRIIMVCKSKDTLSAAIHAASALIYPFQWSHRFYLPVMPESMRHFLQAPFPFLVGLPAELMDFKGLEMDEVTLIDLDLGTCRPEPDSENDDANYLPKKKKLEEALHAAVKALRSPTEFEGNFRIAEIMTGYIVSLFKNYRQFIMTKEEMNAKINQRSGSALTQGRFRFRRSRDGKDRGNLHSRPQSEAALNLFSQDNMDRSGIDAHGFYFDHSKFVASHKSKTERAFLELFRQSQMYEVFIRERLEMASLGVYPKDDPFEYKINLICEHCKKLAPGESVGRTWSRRLSFKPLPQKLSAMAEATMRKSRTLVQGDAAVEQMEALQIEPLLLDTPSSLATVSKRRLGGLKGRDKRFSARQSIKNIVTDMARESSKRLSKPEPGNFLQRSRASFVDRGMDDLPEEHHDTPSDAAPEAEPSVFPFLEDNDEDKTESSEEIEIISTAPARMRSLGVSPNSLTIQSSPWLDTPEQSVFDAWNASPGLGRRSLDSSWFDSSSESSFRYESRMSLRTDSTAATEPLQTTLLRVRSEEMVSRGSADETPSNSPVEASASSDEPKRKQSQADAFLESNLKEFSTSHSVKWGLPPKPQRNGVSK